MPPANLLAKEGGRERGERQARRAESGVINARNKIYGFFCAAQRLHRDTAAHVASEELITRGDDN